MATTKTEQNQEWYIIAEKEGGTIVEITLLTERQAKLKAKKFDVWLARTDGVYID